MQSARSEGPGLRKTIIVVCYSSNGNAGFLQYAVHAYTFLWLIFVNLTVKARRVVGNSMSLRAKVMSLGERTRSNCDLNMPIKLR